MKVDTRKTDPGNRKLVKASAKDIETENSYILTAEARKALIQGAEEMGMDFNKAPTLSVYLETFSCVDGWMIPTLGFLENGVTCRLRQEGKAQKIDKRTNKCVVSKTYPAQISLKKVDTGFQEYANAIAAHRRPEAGFLKARTRKELEFSFSYTELKEMRFQDLPSGEISGIVKTLVNEGKIEGVKSLDELILKPIVATDVARREAHIFIDPNASDPNDFLSTWPRPKLTPKMKKSGRWIELGLCIDKMTVREPRRTLPMSKVVGATKEDLLNPKKFSTLAYVPMVEYEVLNCGGLITDDMLIDTYVDLGIGLRDYAKRMTGFTLVPSWSKGVTGIGACEECRPNGRLHEKYVALQRSAP